MGHRDHGRVSRYAHHFHSARSPSNREPARGGDCRGRRCLATHLANSMARSFLASAAGVAALQLCRNFYPPAIRRSESAILQCVAILVLLTCLAVLPTRAVCPRTARDPLAMRPEIG